MWYTKLGQLVLTYLIRPLIEKGIVALVKYIKRKVKLKKKLEDDTRNATKHENSTSENSTDTFNDMP